MGTFATRSYDNGIPYTQAFINVAGQTQYIGKAEPGTLKTAAHWQIQKLIYDGNGAVTDIQWAKGTLNFDKIMNNYASYTYS